MENEPKKEPTGGSEISDHHLLEQRNTTEAVKTLSEKKDLQLVQGAKHGDHLEKIAKNTEPKEIQKMQMVQTPDEDDPEFNENEAGKNLWAMLRGPKGHTPVKGKEYYTEEERKALVDEILPKATPIAGEHYYTDEEKAKMADEVFSRVRIPADGAPGAPGENAEPVDEEAMEGRLIEKVLPQIPKAEDIAALVPKPDPAKDGSPDTGEDIVKKIYALPDGQRFDYNKLDNLPDIAAMITRMRPNREPKPSQIASKDYATRDLTDVSMQGIVSGQVLQWDGTRFIPYTPAAASFTQVFGEVLTMAGSSFTLAHTPIAGTVRLYRGGQYQQLGVGKDYTMAAAVGTVATAPDQSGNEVFITDYNY